MFEINDYPENFRLPRYREIVRRFGKVMENDVVGYSTRGKRIKEQLVKCIWSGQFLKKKKLFTEDGSKIEVLSPGQWNVEEGPDFKGVEMLLEGKGVIKGDVEIHVYANDWKRHGHGKQQEYDNVCLHVFMWNDGKNKYLKIKDGLVPQLELCKHLVFSLDKLIEIINVEDYPHPAGANAGPCRKELESISSEDKLISHFLDYAGDERILIKKSRFEKDLITQTFEQVFYQTIMESLGYKNNKGQFKHLASIVSINDLRSLIPHDISVNQRSKMIQALLLGMAGLLPGQSSLYKQVRDKGTLDYVKEIEGTWSEIKSKIKNERMDGKLWSFKYCRPGNYPTRRIAAISRLLADNLETGLFRLLLKSFDKIDSSKNKDRQSKEIIKNSESIFLELYDGFWSFYYTFGGKKSKKRECLIGKERSSTIFVNIVIPILLAYARKKDDLSLEEKLFGAYKLHTKLSSNNIIKFMNCRIFGKDVKKRNTVNSARRQQGLLQIYRDFCESDDIACQRCALLLSINSFANAN